VAPPGDRPLAWNGETGENVLFKTRIPLPGANSPVVWGDRVFLTGATREKEEVYCIDAGSGAMLWRKALVVAGRREEPPEPMEDTGFAAPTAVTDGRYVFAIFASGRAAAFDYEGNQVWLRSFGPLDNTYGHSSSLAYFEGRVLLQLDQAYQDDGKSKLVALDAGTGKTLWETLRAVDSSWSSPIVCPTPSGPQAVLSAAPIAAAYDPATGEELWRANVLYGEVAPTPVHHDGTVFIAQQDVGIYAILTSGRGDVTETHVLWSVPAGAPDATSPVTDGERVYMVTTSGYLTCIRIDDGEVLYERELGEQYYASPSIAGDRLLLTSWDGVTTVLETGDTFEVVRKNPLGEGVYASLAFTKDRIYLRAKDHLFAIGRTE
jgi:outer membrane protein assembly factor BamB